MAELRRLRLHLRVVVLLVAACWLGAPAGAVAAPAVDVRGTWSCVSSAGGTCSFDISALDMSSGALSGRGAGNGYTWNVTGKLDGHSLTMKHGPYDQLAYTADYQATVSADGSTMSGTYDDGRGPVQFSYSRTSGPPAGGPPPPPAPPAPAPTPQPPAPTPPTPEPSSSKPRSTVRVICNRAAAPDSPFTCTATVGGSSGGRPTGTVRWTATKGLFTAGNTCMLTSGTFSGNTAYCSVQYAVSGVGTGVAPPVVATYGGDAANGPGSGAPGLLGAPVDFTSPAPLCMLAASCASGIDVKGIATRELSETTPLLLDVGCYAGPVARASQAGRQLSGCGVTAEASLTELEALRKAAEKGLSSTRKEDQLKAQQDLQRLDREIARMQGLARSQRKAGGGAARSAAARPRIRQRPGVRVARVTGRIAAGTRGTVALAVPKNRGFVLRALRAAGVKRARLRIRVAVTRNGDRRASVRERTIRIALR